MAGRHGSSNSWSGLQGEGSFRSSQAAASAGTPSRGHDADSSLVSVRDARQQRYERTTGRPLSAKGQQQSSQRVGRDPALSTSLAAAFRRPPADKPPSLSGGAVTAAQHMAASFASGPPRRQVTGSAAAPASSLAASTSRPPVPSLSPAAAASASNAGGSAFRPSYPGSAASVSGEPAPPYRSLSTGSGSATSSGQGSSLGLAAATPLTTRRSDAAAGVYGTAHSPLAPFPHHDIHTLSESQAAPWLSAPTGQTSAAAGSSSTSTALVQSPGRARPLVPSTSSNGRPPAAPSPGAPASSHPRGASSAPGPGIGAGPGLSGAGSGGCLPPHLASLLAEPPALLAPNEDVDGDTATALALHDAREEGSLRVTMRGLQQLPVPVVRFLKVEGLNLRQLSLTGNRLSVMPPPEQLSNLLSLDLSANQLHLIPDALHHLSRLHTLTVAENSLSQLPASLSALTCLVSMDAGNNQLSELPVGVSALTRLQHIKLDRNELQCLPAGLFTLPTLRTVSACHNRLVGLPVEVGAAAQLESLALHHNRLTALPDTVGELQHALTDLQLSDNHLTILPRELARLSRLQRLTTSGNPLMFPPKAVCRRGLTAIRVYLMQHLDSWEGEGKQGQAGAETEPAHVTTREAEAEAGCERCRQLEVQVQTLGSTALQQQLDRERAERETAAVRSQLQQQEQVSISLDQQVRQLLADKLSSERNLHARSAHHLASAEDLERQVLQLRVSLSEAQGTATSAEGRCQEAQEQLQVERQRAAAAMHAALSAQADVKRLQVLEEQLSAARKENERMDGLIGHHQFHQRAAEDRQAEAEAKLDQMMGKVQAVLKEQDATHQLLAVERSQAAVQAAMAQQRERHLQAELQRLQAQVSVLLSEREQLHQQHLLAGNIVSVLTDAECQTDRIVAPDADAVGNARREAARRETGKQLQWRQPQLL